MPNHITNRIEIKGDADRIGSIMEKIKNDENRRCFSVKKGFEPMTLDTNQGFWKCFDIFKGIVTDFRIKLFHKICKPILLFSHKVENR